MDDSSSSKRGWYYLPRSYDYPVLEPMNTYWDAEAQEFRPAATKLLWPKLSSNGHPPARPEPGPAETLFLAGFVFGAAMWLAWARWLRLW